VCPFCVGVGGSRGAAEVNSETRRGRYPCWCWRASRTGVWGERHVGRVCCCWPHAEPRSRRGFRSPWWHRRKVWLHVGYCEPPGPGGIGSHAGGFSTNTHQPWPKGDSSGPGPLRVFPCGSAAPREPYAPMPTGRVHPAPTTRLRVNLMHRCPRAGYTRPLRFRST